MNHIYRLTWNESLRQYVAAPETARGRHKAGGRAGRRLAGAALAAVLIGASSLAQALPVGAQPSAGSGSVAQNGATLTVNQSSQRLALNWQSFGIGSGETVNFVQPNAAAIALNRVLGSDGSAIYGKLTANGQVFLLNPNGILFGKGAEVNVGALVASTLNLSDADFMAGRRVFGGGSGAGGSALVTNLGQINADGGYIAFLGGQVSNQGILRASLGTVALAAGSRTSLDFAGDKLISVQVEQGALQALAENRQLVQADGGTVIMTARAADHLVSAVVNNTGVIRARTLQNHAGVISLLGDMQSGVVNAGGTLDASAPAGGNGGFIETSAATVRVAAGTLVTTAAAAGLYGNWLIDPHDYTVAASGGDITGAALSASLGSTNVILQSSSGAASSSAGNVNVNDAVTWAASTSLTLNASNHVNVNAAITATGAGAGLAINPNSANGGEAASGTGVFHLAAGATINLPNVAASSTTALVIGGTPYAVINSLGTAGDGSALSLQGIAGNLSGHYALGSSIDAAATAGWNNRAGFTPIAAGDTGFTGTLEGLGHGIAGLTINAAPGLANIGLFGTLGSGGVVSNLSLNGGSVRGNADGTAVGAIAGLNNGTLANVFSSASVFGAGTYFAGGLVGSNAGVISNASTTGSVAGGPGSFEVGGLSGENNGSIGNAHATGAVSGGSDVGGLVGVNYGGISNAYATGNVSGTVRIGGLVGNNAAGSIGYAYAKGAVTGTSVVGGLVGLNANNATVGNTYATGAASGTSSGALSGSNKGAISSSYWNSDVKAVGNGANTGRLTAVGGLTATQMRTTANLAGFAFSGTPGASGWVLVDADGSLNNAGGAAGATTPMLASEYATTVVNAHQLQLMAMAPGANYLMGRGIDAAATAGGKDVWGSAGFVPVGSSASPYAGVFDGASLAISGLTINTPSSNRVGLFGDVLGGTLKNVGIVGGSITGSLYVGGLVGVNDGGMLSNVYASNAVSGRNQVGGLAGANLGSISMAYATGKVSGTSTVGGLAGSNTGTISGVYATGPVTGSSDTGGLVGSNSGTLAGSFWNRSINATGVGTDTGAGTGATGLYTAQLQTQANLGAATDANGNVKPGWDFQSGWIGYDGFTGPLLRSFMTPLTVTANDATKTYNAQLYTANGATYSATPDARLLGALTYGGTAQSASNAGTYAITPGGLYSNQQGYALTFVGGTLNITPATLTVQGTVVASKVYDGGTLAVLGGGRLNGVIGGDAVLLNQNGAFGRKTVGDGIAVTAADTLSGAAAGNYVLVEPSGLFASITPRQLTVDGSTALSRIYDGSTVAGVVGGTIGGAIGGDALTLNQSATFASRNAGAGIAVKTINTLGGAASGNYTLATPQTLFADITARQLTVLGTPGGNKIYDGSTSVVVSGGQLAGGVAGDIVNLFQAGSFADKNVGKDKLLNFRNALNGADAGNYSLSAAGGTTTASIVARELNVLNTAAANKVYDGATTASVTATLSGGVAGDDLALVQGGSFSNKNAGNARLVSYQNSLAGVDMGNYRLLSLSGTTAASITARSLTVAGTEVAGKVYDGTTKAKLTGGVLVGVVAGDTVKLTQLGAFTTKNAGASVAVTATDSIGGASAGNYVLVGPGGLHAAITPKLLTVAGATHAAGKTYDATTAATITGGTLAGVIGGDTVKLTQAGRFSDKNVGSAKSVFYTNTLSGTDAANYSVSALPGLAKARIAALQLTVGGDTSALSKVFDGTMTALVSGGIIEGVLRGDIVNLAQSGAFLSKSAGSGKVVNYRNVIGGRDAGNYSLVDKKGSVTADITAL